MSYLSKVEESIQINVIKSYFILISCAVIFLGILINYFEKYLPVFIQKTFRCGKHGYKGSTTLPTVEFPKSSFKQFYELGLLCMIVAYFLVCYTYIFGFNIPSTITYTFDALNNDGKIVTDVSATKVFIAITLMGLQIGRRYYDTHFVSVFGKNSRINLTHWIVGITYYPMVILAILCEAPNFITPEVQKVTHSQIGMIEIIGIFLFFWGWKHQHICTVILADIRRKQGVEDGYKLPDGDWFEYLSSPHCNAEILMYIALTFFLWQNNTWWYVMLWIFSNQIESILLSHWWYKENFKDFPKNRKALLPYIY